MYEDGTIMMFQNVSIKLLFYAV